MSSKRDLLETAAGNPFVDPDLCRRHIEAKRKRFEDEVVRQKAAADR
jgi:hypothetical protein